MYSLSFVTFITSNHYLRSLRSFRKKKIWVLCLQYNFTRYTFHQRKILLSRHIICFDMYGISENPFLLHVRSMCRLISDIVVLHKLSYFNVQESSKSL